MDQKTIDAYNQRADEYDKKTSDFWVRFPVHFRGEFIKRSGKMVIDLGSGSGRDGLFFQRAGKEVICLDASESMVNLSREKGLQSIRANFEKLPFADETFDGVWSYMAYLHLPKKSFTNAIKEVFRILRPSGIFALGLIEGDTEGYIEKTRVGMTRWFSFYEKEEVIDLVGNCGFDLIYYESFRPEERNYLNFIFKKSR